MKKIKFLMVMSVVIFHSISGQAQENKETKFSFPKDRKINVGVLVYDGVEIVDTGGPIDVFVKANNSNNKYNIYTVSATQNKNIIMDGNTVNLVSKYNIFDAPQADILIIPGTSPEIVAKVSADKKMMNWIVDQNNKTQMTMSVCTGGLILANTGLLDGRSATTHHWSIDELKSHSKINVQEKKRFVVDGKFLTGAGVTSGMDVALEAIELIHGKDVADDIAHGMVYNRYGTMEFLPKK
ncbi:DJ-1/PfpI family protein [Pedobacter rhizosphaerae]|uniref:DJ-1/PfpI family protein n=1 Tax=Pedobacter rhizosphaerae TaxID=390241 RepID=A0A1H9VQ36_9SPHI|nr:DJ-1/PfpI family protein [Pedobacter rhizosphaerae]SES23755.1 DJ-1/PfpI family protein [Pedobacter rhizosphaerae]